MTSCPLQFNHEFENLSFFLNRYSFDKYNKFACFVCSIDFGGNIQVCFHENKHTGHTNKNEKKVYHSLFSGNLPKKIEKINALILN